MTSLEKAAQLVVDNQLKIRSLDYKEAVQCAIVTVDEILNALDLNDWDHDCGIASDKIMFWNDVKQILERL